MMNKILTNSILNYKTNNINTLEILKGHYIFNNKFSKIIDKGVYDSLYLKFINYEFKNYKKKIYIYNNHFLEITNNNKTHLYKNNYTILKLDNTLLYTLNSEILDYPEFSCKKNYHSITQNIIEFIINPDISVHFIETNKKYSIKIIANLNHNSDLSIKIINNLIKELEN